MLRFHLFLNGQNTECLNKNTMKNEKPEIFIRKISGSVIKSMAVFLRPSIIQFKTSA